MSYVLEKITPILLSFFNFKEMNNAIKIIGWIGYIILGLNYIRHEWAGVSGCGSGCDSSDADSDSSHSG